MTDLYQYGVCRLACVHLRQEPSHTSEMVSQLLFGEAYRVNSISENFKWLNIKTLYDDYTGWIQIEQHLEVSEMYFLEYERKRLKFKVLKQRYALVGLDDGTEFLISIGSVLPFEKNNMVYLGDVKVEILDKPYKVKVNDGMSLSKEILIQVDKFLGAPYLWGGRSIFGVDCSGFVQQVYKTISAHYFLPRDSSQQAKIGVEVPLSEAKIGDLAFFSNEKGNIHHVGILLDKKSIVHASGEVKIDKIDERGIQNKNLGNTHQLAFVKRILADD
ncbi:MAG: C40 family peptidase [Flammeovirgaceae bacterium]